MHLHMHMHAYVCLHQDVLKYVFTYSCIQIYFISNTVGRCEPDTRPLHIYLCMLLSLIAMRFQINRPADLI